MIPPLLKLAHAVTWAGRSYLVKVGLDKSGHAREVEAQALDGRASDLAQAERWVNEALEHAHISVVSRAKAEDWQSAEFFLAREVLVIEDQAGPIVRAAYRHAGQRVAREQAERPRAVAENPFGKGRTMAEVGG